ncbi:hypothetical protein N5W20_03695 [Candidatus Kirkpatrickella diaphorinae]|uniref:Uncharacterized protein n=1 Tax=Candidatus Kirkpatrickella diaphorinae TaxID=2984322 RepID=A0ABY6GM34_9PROT|nr:hypothetical protein [Candidatus Kirkpatrickella diaphorinae]UYH51970.1 hypothetical protein N5W20_03695 [Candidatus Kirkpatrickella diaphorinae]
MRFPLYTILSLSAFLCASGPAFADGADCPSSLTISQGEHRGYLRETFSKVGDDSGFVTFLFEDENDKKLYCIRQTYSNSPNVLSVAEKAYLLHNEVDIIAKNPNTLFSIGFNMS